MTKRSGDALEALVRKGINSGAFAAQGLSIEQVRAPFVGKVGPCGRAHGRIVAKAGLDFSGDHRGRRVLFDTKSTTGKSLSLDEKMVKPHQARAVRDGHERGAIAFLLVEFTALDDGLRYYALTWPVLAPYWEAIERHRYTGAPAAKSIPLRVFESQAHPITRSRSGLELPAAIAHLIEHGGPHDG